MTYKVESFYDDRNLGRQNHVVFLTYKYDTCIWLLTLMSIYVRHEPLSVLFTVLRVRAKPKENVYSTSTPLQNTPVSQWFELWTDVCSIYDHIQMREFIFFFSRLCTYDIYMWFNIYNEKNMKRNLFDSIGTFQIFVLHNDPSVCRTCMICTLYTAVVSKCMYIIIPWREVLVSYLVQVLYSVRGPGPGTRLCSKIRALTDKWWLTLTLHRMKWLLCAFVGEGRVHVMRCGPHRANYGGLKPSKS